MKNFIKKNLNIIVIVFLIFIIFIFIDGKVGKSIFANTPWNSYELQARAWLKGKLFLDQNYPYLELAIYNGNYYVSFPPLPSVILLPFAVIFPPGEIPANFLSFLIFATEFIIIYKILKRYDNKEYVAILLALGFTLGTNLVSLTVDSGVWFFAQLLNNLFCILAVDAFLKNRRALVYVLLALAVGCRPFSAIYMVMFFIYYLVTDKEKSFYKRILNNLKPVIPCVFIAILYMFYNYIRFGNILEFGRQYLPEFSRGNYKQFSIKYLGNNLRQYLFNGIHVDRKLNISFDMPFAFYLANPIMIAYAYHSIRNIVKTKKTNLLRIMLFVSIIINILLICLHRTLGAWQFGARYSCDVLPFVFLGFVFKKNDDCKIKLDIFEIICIIFGVLLNIYGAIVMYRM